MSVPLDVLAGIAGLTGVFVLRAWLTHRRWMREFEERRLRFDHAKRRRIKEAVERGFWEGKR